MVAGKPTIVDVEAVMDGTRFGGLPLLVMMCTAAILVLDGFDIQVIGFAAPAIAAELGLQRSDLVPVLAASLIGMTLGGFVLGPWGDRRGRRPALILSVLTFGLGTLLTATASGVAELAFWRFLTGVGLGGALPNATALMAEFAPPRVRSQAITAAIVGIPIGGMVGATIAAEILPIVGWKGIFVVGGVLPLLALILIWFVLPESPRYLATHPERKAELTAILNRIAGDGRYSGNESFVLTRQMLSVDMTARGVFSRDLLRDTIATCLIFTANLFSVYCFYNWAPVVLTTLGMDLPTAVRGSLVFNAAGLVGAIAGAWVVARLGSRWPLAILGVVGSLALLYLSQLMGEAARAPALLSVSHIMIGIAVAGLAILAMSVAMYAVAAHVYPTSCRSSGIGLAGGMGRIGGLLSALFGAAIMARAGAAGFFVSVAGIFALTVLGVLMLRRHIPGRAGSQ